jgi:hypothetical protein
MRNLLQRFLLRGAPLEVNLQSATRQAVTQMVARMPLSSPPDNMRTVFDGVQVRACPSVPFAAAASPR